MKYEDFIFKIPIENKDYNKDSKFVTETIVKILDERKSSGDNRIFINTNLKKAYP